MRFDGLLPIVPLVLAVAAIGPVQHWLEHAAAPSVVEDEALYLSNGDAVKAMALGYDSLLADVYWMRAIQYFGGKVLSDQTILDQQSDRLPLLHPLVDVATTLDPQLIPAYRFGSYFIHDYGRPAEARALLEKGIRNNPDNPWLYQDLAFAEWQDGDCAHASQVYAAGAERPNAPSWMRSMSAAVLADCGQRSLAVQMLRTMYESTEDPRIRADIKRQLDVYQALDELDLLNAAVAFYAERIGPRPRSLAQVVRTILPRPQPGLPNLTLDRTGSPVDPNGVPYVYDADTGVVSADPSSMTLPRSEPRQH
ncbi:MAG TPA: hypothetical protein PLF26_12280 [Blastocatellia bacterium]|nr:hypothetical protein [Blastocatellia bacterium]